VHETLSQKTLSQKNLVGGVAQGEGSEFNPSTEKKKKSSWDIVQW
jgi:hypothetical protein